MICGIVCCTTAFFAFFRCGCKRFGLLYAIFSALFHTRPQFLVLGLIHELCKTAFIFAQCTIYIPLLVLSLVNTAPVFVIRVTADLVNCAFSACFVPQVYFFSTVLSSVCSSACCTADRACSSCS